MIKLFKKAIITLTLLFVLLLAISSVVAVENVTMNQTSGDNHVECFNNDDVLESNVNIDSESDSNLSNYEDNSLLTYSPGGYNGLSDQINKYSGDTFYLSYDYRYTFTTDTTPEIEISRSITIDGCGHSINGNAVAGGFHITKGYVTLKNIKFMNCRPSTKYSSLGTAIIIDGDAADVTIEKMNMVEQFIVIQTVVYQSKTLILKIIMLLVVEQFFSIPMGHITIIMEMNILILITVHLNQIMD